MSDDFDVPNAKAIKQTPPKAGHEGSLLVKAKDLGPDPVWILQSQITDDSEVYKEGHEGTLIVYRWFAEDEGWL